MLCCCQWVAFTFPANCWVAVIGTLLPIKAACIDGDDAIYMTLSLWVEEKLVGKNNSVTQLDSQKSLLHTKAHKRLTINSRWHLQLLPFEYWCVRCGGNICEIKEILLS